VEFLSIKSFLFQIYANSIILYVRGIGTVDCFLLLFLNMNEGDAGTMLKRLREKLKKRLKDFLGKERVPTTFEEENHYE